MNTDRGVTSLTDDVLIVSLNEMLRIIEHLSYDTNNSHPFMVINNISLVEQEVCMIWCTRILGYEARNVLT